jgi:hypothetical protein
MTGGDKAAKDESGTDELLELDADTLAAADETREEDDEHERAGIDMIIMHKF